MRCDRSLARALATALASALVFSIGVSARAEEDEELKKMFRDGVEAYQHGQIADAIRFWESLYARSGPKRGYRVAFNLARAYAIFGDATHSAQDYEAFLAEVDAERQNHDPLDATVVKEEGEARAELDALKAKNGRLYLLASAPPVAVSVDDAAARVSGFTLYLPPGPHRLVFAPGTPTESARTVDLEAGKETLVHPPPTPAAATPSPAPAPKLHTEHPFSPVVLYVAGGVTVASILVPILTYSHASSVRDDVTSSNANLSNLDLRSQYTSARSTAYATLAIPLGLAAVTGGLTAWYFAGTHQVPDAAADKQIGASILPMFTVDRGGGSLGAVGVF